LNELRGPAKPSRSDIQTPAGADHDTARKPSTQLANEQGFTLYAHRQDDQIDRLSLNPIDDRFRLSIIKISVLDTCDTKARMCLLEPPSGLLRNTGPRS
jgi:hypothetical protein